MNASSLDNRSFLKPGTTVQKSLPGLELAGSGILALLFPASMNSPWGSLGAYVAAAVTVLVIVGFVRCRAQTWEISKVVPIPMFAVIAISTALAAMTQQYDASYIRGTPVQWTAFLGIISLAGLWQLRGGNPIRWVQWLLWTSAAVSCLAMWEYISRDYIRLDDLYSFVSGIHFDDSAYRRSPDSFRSISTMGNPLALGTFTSVAAAGSLGFYFETAGLPYLFLFIVNSMATFASLSRSCWLALLASTLLLVFGYLFNRRFGTAKMHLHLLAFALAIVIAVSIPSSQDYIVERISESFETASGRILELQDSFSYSHRTSALADALTSMMESPHSLLIGFGLGAENSFFLASTATPLTGITSKDASLIRTFDNTYVTLAYSFGSLGLFWFVRTLFLRTRLAFSARPRPFWYLGMLVAAIICLYFYNGVSAPSASFIAACLLGFRIGKGGFLA
jgi:hypothetical protein